MDIMMDPCSQCGGKDIDVDIHHNLTDAKRICNECGWVVELERVGWVEGDSYYDKKILERIKCDSGLPCPTCNIEARLCKVFPDLLTASYWCPNCNKEIIWTQVEKFTFPRAPEPPKGREVP